MRKDREELEYLVEQSITEIHTTRKIQKEIRILAESFLSKWFYKQKIIQILNKNCPMSTLNDNELYNVALFLNSQSLLKVDLEEYYSGEEMSDAIDDKVTILRDYSREVVFDGMKYNGSDTIPQWVGFINLQDIPVMFEGGVFNYNFATQRKAKIVKIRNRTYRIATISSTNVNEIAEEVLKGKFECNTITLNIRVGDGEEYLYDSSTGKLHIDLTKTLVDTVDGYHRINGIYKAWKKNKNIQGSMILLVKHMDTEQARYFIAQEAKGTINNLDDLKSYNASTNVAKLINNINRYSNNNMLFNAIPNGEETDSMLMYYDLFAKIMDIVWAEKLSESNNIELVKIKEFICDFYTLIYDILKDKFKVNDIKELPILALDQMFMAGILFPAFAQYTANSNISIDDIKRVANKLYNKIIDNDVNLTYTDENNLSEMDRYIKSWERVK